MASLRQLPLLAAAGIGVSLAVSACNPVTPYAAVVNGTVISQSAVTGEAAAIQSDPAQASGLKIQGAGPGTYSTSFLAKVLTRQIDFVVVEQALARRHLDVTSGDLTAARADLLNGLYTPAQLARFPGWYRSELIRRQADETKLFAAVAHADVSAGAVAAYYAAHRDDFLTVCGARIVVSTPAAAAQVESDLAKGASFEAEAAAKSQDTQTSSQGGQLGCAPGLAYQQSFGPLVGLAVETRPVGVALPAIAQPEGLTIFEVLSRSTPAPATALSTVRSYLVSSGQSAAGTLINTGLVHSSITVDARFGRWTTAKGQDQVVPPAAPKVRSDSR